MHLTSLGTPGDFQKGNRRFSPFVRVWGESPRLWFTSSVRPQWQQRWDMHNSLGIAANTAVTEVHLPSELTQGICVRCVIEAWSFSCIHALHDIQASCLSDAEIASVESGTSVWRDSIRTLNAQGAFNSVRSVLANVKTIGKEDRTSSPLGRLLIKNQGVKPNDFDFDFINWTIGNSLILN